MLYMVHVPQVGDGLTVVSESGINDSRPILRPALPMGERQRPHRQQIPKRLRDHFGCKPRASGQPTLAT